MLCTSLVRTAVSTKRACTACRVLTHTFHLHRCTVTVHFPTHLFHHTCEHSVIFPWSNHVNTQPSATPLNRVSRRCGIVDQSSIFVPCDARDGPVVKPSRAACEDSGLMCSRDAVSRLDCNFLPSWPTRSKSSIVCRRHGRGGEVCMHSNASHRCPLGFICVDTTTPHSTSHARQPLPFTLL